MDTLNEILASHAVSATSSDVKDVLLGAGFIVVNKDGMSASLPPILIALYASP
jgi:hypothetical protein